MFVDSVWVHSCIAVVVTQFGVNTHVIRQWGKDRESTDETCDN